MLNPLTPDPHNLPISKDREFGEYINEKDHRCPCFEKGDDGPPQYELRDVYFCFAKFPNKFVRKWISRYAAMTVLCPVLDVLHAYERQEGRSITPSEWPLVPGVLIQGIKPMKTTAKGLSTLFQKVELWLKGNMIDEIDHRLIKARTASEWRKENAELCARYAAYPWTLLGSKGNKWMRLHSSTNMLEMLRRTDHAYTVMSPRYEEPAKEAGDGEETNRKTKAADAALSSLESVDTTAVQEELIDLST